MNMKQLKYVLTLAQQKSFSNAADVLGISQPSLSQYIKKIEKEIGLPLFDRTNGDVRLTDAGQVYIDAGRKILELEHQMEVSFSDLSENKAGSLIVGVAPYRAAGMMPAVAKAFSKVHPGMHLVIREGTTAELSEGMEHGEYDLAVTLLPLEERLFTWEVVTEEELILAVPSSFSPFKARKMQGRKYPALDAKLLNDQRFVMLTDNQFMQRRLWTFASDNHLRLETAAVVKSLQAQIAMVRAGVGIALMPSGIETFCRPGEVTFYSLVQPLPGRELVVMWQKERKLSKAAEELKNIIKGIDI